MEQNISIERLVLATVDALGITLISLQQNGGLSYQVSLGQSSKNMMQDEQV